MRNAIVSLLNWTVMFVGSLLANPAWADPREIPGYPTNVQASYDMREISLLPRYCIHTQLFREHVPGGNNRTEIDYWYKVQGKTFHHMHHYCWGLMRTNRALFLTKKKGGREHYLNKSIQDFDYVINRAPENFVLLPEILSKKGENLIRLGRGPMALPHLQHAIKLRPDYWPPYVTLSDYFVETGELDKARQVLNAALSHSPQAKAVQERLAKLRTAGGTSVSAGKSNR